MTAADQIQAAETQMKTDRTSLYDRSKGRTQRIQRYRKSPCCEHQRLGHGTVGDIQSLENTWWTDRQTARMDEFSTNDQRRNGVLSNLTAKGIDVSQAQAVETQIQQEGTVLNAALTSRDESAISAANEDLATLNKQFAEVVKGYRAWAHEKS